MSNSDIDIGPGAKKDGPALKQDIRNLEMLLKTDLRAFEVWFLKRFIGLLLIHGTVIVVAIKLLC